MAIDYIRVTIADNFRATRLARSVRILRECLDQLEEVKNTLDHVVADPVYTGVEGGGGFGVPTGKGQEVYNLVAGAYARLNHADVTNFINRVGE